MKATFLRVIEAEEKSEALRDALSTADESPVRFEAGPEGFSKIPKSPFAYWVSDRIRELFETLPPLESDGRTAKQGLATADDFRFVRLWWEIAPDQVGRGRRWVPFAKGGKYSPFYADVYLMVNWENDGAELKTFDRSVIRNPNYYFRPGLTWSLRSQIGLSVRALPSGCIFGHKGPGVFVDGEHEEVLSRILAQVSSQVFSAFVELQMAFGSYEVGVIQRTPLPAEPPMQLSELAVAGWTAKRNRDAADESSHAFCVPALVQGEGEIARRGGEWLKREAEWADELAKTQNSIDELSWDAYEISDSDRQRLEIAALTGDISDDDENDEDESFEGTELTAELVALASWSVGVSFGRFDIRRATGERPVPDTPGPFDPLPVACPGMLTGKDELPLNEAPDGYRIPFPPDGTLIDDPGNDRDLTKRVRDVLLDVFRPHGQSHLDEMLGSLDLKSKSLQRWIATSFFHLHIQRYSRKPRKAPIYWQLATPSASYSVWLYVHRLSKDTFFRVREIVDEKLRHEENRLESMKNEAGPSPLGKAASELDAQEQFVSELRTFREEVARVAPLWNPDLNDGVVINCAPLWRLFPQNRSWQKECLKRWGKLVDEEYEWAHWAMHLWPERVVPKCAKDRSLAIAHGLEDVFWQEVDHGKWKPKKASKETIDQLVAERTSAAVKDALRNLLDAPPPAGGKTKRKRKSKSARSA